MATPQKPLSQRSSKGMAASTQMVLTLSGMFFVAVFVIGTLTGINWVDEFTQLVSPASYQNGPNQNYCVMIGRERYLRKPGQTRMTAPCFVNVENGEGIRRIVNMTFNKDYSSDELLRDLPSSNGKYSLWRRKIYNGEVQQTKLFDGDASAFVNRHSIQDVTDNPGYMAYFIIPGTTAQQCGDNVDLSICTKLVVGEVLWW